jgi:hypothetical protein
MSLLEEGGVEEVRVEVIEALGTECRRPFRGWKHRCSVEMEAWLSHHHEDTGVAQKKWAWDELDRETEERGADITNLAITSLVAHSTSTPRPSASCAISQVLTNAPTGNMVAHKQLVLVIVLKELIKADPPDAEMQNSLAVISTILLGSRLLTAVSTSVRPDRVQ